MKHLLALVLLVAGTVSAMAQTAANRSDAKGRQGVWKVWLDRKLNEADDSVSAPYYRIVTYTDNDPAGPFTDYDREGVRQRTGTVTRFGGRTVLDGEITSYRQTGSVASIEEFRRGVQHGRYEKFDVNGNRTTIGQFDDGDRIGEWTTYYSNGQLKTRGSYFEGARDGAWTTYLEDGTVKESVVYVDGVLQDWTTLLTQLEAAVKGEDLQRAARLDLQAERAIRGIFGDDALPMARLLVARTCRLWLQKDETTALKTLDTVFVICDAHAAAGRTYRRESLGALLRFTRDHPSPILTRRLVPMLVTLLETDTVIRTEQAATLIQQGGEAAMRSRETLLYREIMMTADKMLAIDVVQPDSLLRTELYGFWGTMAMSASVVHDQASVEIAARQVQAWAPKGGSGNSQATFESIASAIGLIIVDGSTTPEQMEQRLDQFLESLREKSDTLYCFALAQAAIHPSIYSESAYIFKILDRGAASCQDVPSVTGILWNLLLAQSYAIKGQCDTAAAYMARVDELRRETSYPDEPVESIRSRVAACQSNERTFIHDSIPPLYANSRPSAKKISQRELIALVVPFQPNTVQLALDEGSSSTVRLSALLYLDTIITSADELRYQERYRNIQEHANSAVVADAPPRKRAEQLFRYLQDSVFVRYDEMVSFHRVLNDGTFNCASAVALYSLLCHDLTIPLLYYQAPGHITCGVPDGDQVIFVELTSPKDGFGFDRERDSVIDHLLSYKLITREEIDVLGADSLYRQYMEHRRTASFSSVLAAVAGNAFVRGYLEANVEQLNRDSYGRFISAIALDTGSVGMQSLIEFSWAFSTEQIIRQYLKDLGHLAAYLHADTSSYAIVAVAGGMMMLRLADLDHSYQPDNDCLIFHAHAPTAEPKKDLSSVIDAFCATTHAFLVSQKGDLGLAFAYLRHYLPDSAWAMHPNALGVTEQYVRQLFDEGDNDEALKLAREIVIKSDNRVSSTLLQESIYLYLTSNRCRTLDTARYRELVQELFRRRLEQRTEKEHQWKTVYSLVSEAVFRVRYDLARIAVEEASNARFAADRLGELRGTMALFMANKDKPVDADDLDLTVSLHLHDADGPRTSTLPSRDASAAIRIRISGLSLGQVLEYTVRVEVPGMPDVIRWKTDNGANNTEMIVAFSMPAPPRGVVGDGIIEVLVDGDVVGSYKYTVQ